MLKNFIEEEKHLHCSREKLNIDISSRIQNAWKYFKLLGVNMDNFNINKSKQITFYRAPVVKIHGSMGANWPVDNGTDIYLDYEFFNNNSFVIDCQIMHEILHTLSELRNPIQNFFGHQLDLNQNTNLFIGINEATTQMFAEDIQNIRLTEKDDYLYFVKNIMRVIKSIFGSYKIASQYLNNDIQFELDFNKITRGKFALFVSMMNENYFLSKKKHYNTNKLVEEEMKQLDLMLKINQEEIINFTKLLISSFMEKYSQLIQNIINELKDENFVNKLGILNNNFVETSFRKK